MTATASAATPSGFTARAMTALAVIYPLAAHLAVLSANANYVAASIALLVVLILMPALSRWRGSAWGLLLIAAAGLYVVVARGQVLLLLFLPPVLINVFMAWLFGGTLRAQRQPLIERIIRALHGERDDLDPAILAYARRLTFAWTVLFAVLAIINLALAALASPGGFVAAAGFESTLSVPLGVWSLFANLLNYVIVGAMFSIEFQLRRRRFPQQSYRGFFDFLHKLSRVSPIFRPTGQRRL